MSHYRNLGGGKRDANEPQIMKRFADHGWHVEQISGNRLWDLLAFNLRTGPHSVCLVDVKMRDGNVTPAQVEKWSVLYFKGIPVYVARTDSDVDAIVAGKAEPWGVVESRQQRGRRPKPKPIPDQVGKRLEMKIGLRSSLKVNGGMGIHLYDQDVPGPIRRKTAEQRAMLAAQAAEETFAPGQDDPGTCRVPECDEMRVAHGYCAVHALQGTP